LTSTTSKAAGDYTINVKTTGPVKVTGIHHDCKTRRQAADLDVAGARCRRRRDRQSRRRYQGPEGLSLARHYALDVKAATQILARRSIRTLAKGESLTLTSDMFSDLVSGTAACRFRQPVHRARCRDHPQGAGSLSARLFGTDHQPRHAAALRQRPRRGRHLAMDTAVDQRIKDAIERLLARQGSNGSFGLWSAGRRRCLARFLCD